MKPRIVTLAQLAELPLGSVISPINFQMEGDFIDRDIQGTVKMRPKTVLTGVDYHWLHTTDELPDVRIEEGRVYTSPAEHTYARDSGHPWRFVVWSTPE